MIKNGLLLIILSISLQGQSQSLKDNDLYQAALNKDGSVTLRLKTVSKAYIIQPRFMVMQREDDPKSGTINAHRIVKDFRGVVTIPTWKLRGSEDRTPDFFLTAKPFILTASSAKINGNQIIWAFPAHADFKLEVTFTLPDEA